MEEIIRKLNYKGQDKVLLMNSPADLKDLQDTFEKHAAVHTSIKEDKYNFALVFAIEKSTIDDSVPLLNKVLEGDAILWFAYPKGTSKRYKCNFNRDTGWESLGKFNFEPVRQVAIDEDWSALRFRRIDYIKKMTRNEKMILSEKGKSKTDRKGK